MKKSALYVVAELAVGLTILSSTALCPALATRLPSELTEEIHNSLPGSKIRLDGAIETSGGELFLPLIPNPLVKKRSKVYLDAYLPNQQNPDALLYSNGWSYLRVLKIGNRKSVNLPAQLSPKDSKQIMGGKFPGDLIVPENFVMPQSLKPVIGDTAIALVRDETILNAFGKGSPVKSAKAEHGVLFLTSIKSGVITMVDDRTLSKIAEFPTEGTPSGMVLVDGKLFITDEAKSRILLLDPSKRQFLGQINLPPHSAPKGIAATPNGQLIYVSENGAGDVAIIEAGSRKVILRTKVAAGPGRLVLSPDSKFMIVLNVTAGQATIISTANQRVLATVQVGSVPTAVVISPDSKTAYVSNRMSNTVSVIDINSRTVRAKIPTGAGPTGLAINDEGSKLYVANAREDSIAVYDTKTDQKLQEARLPAEIDFPGSLMVMPDGKHLLISSEATENISLMSLDTLEFVKQSSIGHFSHDIIWVPLD